MKSMSMSIGALLIFTTLGCAHLESARLGDIHASSTIAITGPDGPHGIVDLAEPPHVVDGNPVRAPALVPGPLLAATKTASWLPLEHDGPVMLPPRATRHSVIEIELRNNCSLDFDYDFGPLPGSEDTEHPRRILAGHTLELQRVVAGQWLHLWDGDRWLASAATTVDGARMEISWQCDSLEIEADFEAHGPTRFAIRWELDADSSLAAAPISNTASDVAVEAQERAQPWGPDGDRIELRLTNLCAEAIDYTFAPDFDGTPELSSSLAGRSERRVAIPPGWWLRYRVFDEDWRGGATTSIEGGVVWITADCIDFGVADGRFVRP